MLYARLGRTCPTASCSSIVSSSLPKSTVCARLGTRKRMAYTRARQTAILYPPTDNPALRKLLSALTESETFDTLKTDCLIYYLLRDYKDDRALIFARLKCIVSLLRPPKPPGSAHLQRCLAKAICIYLGCLLAS